LAYVITHLSAFIVVGHDHSEEATVGIITFRGFPVWFIEQAPGISIMSSWHFDRFQINLGVWFAILLLTATAIHIMIRRRKMKGSNQAFQAIGDPGSPQPES